MPRICLVFEKEGLKILIELNKFSIDKIVKIRDYLLSDETEWNVSSYNSGESFPTTTINIIEIDATKIRIVCGMCDVITQFTNDIKNNILSECERIISTS